MNHRFVTSPVAVQNGSGLALPPGLFPEPLIEAYGSLSRHLWPALRAEPWWATADPVPSVQAAHTAADFLDRLGFDSVVVSGTLSAFPHDEKTGEPVLAEAIAVGKSTPWSPTTHAFVLIHHEERVALLETALFQMQRAEFCKLPDMAMIAVLEADAANLLSPDGTSLTPAIMHAATWRAPDRCPQGWVLDVVWGVLRDPIDWSTYAEADPAKAEATASRIAQAQLIRAPQ